MKTLWILSALIGFTLPEKLDRTYLPPPGSKFSGGSPGENDVPLEFPKETYPSSSQDNHFGLPEIAIGINRLSSSISPEKYGDITSKVPPFHGNSYSFPTTTSPYAFSETTSHVPAADHSNGPEISINSKYPFNSPVNNPTSSYLKEKNLSLDHARPNYAYNAVEGKQMLNDINDILENDLPDNVINPQVVIKSSGESVHSYNGDINGTPENNSHFGNLGTSDVTSIPTEIDHSLSNNNDNDRSPSLSESIMEQDVNLISSTPKPSENVYYNTPSQYVSASQTGITNSPYSYRPERIQAQDREAVILAYENKITPDGYTYSFDTSNGIHADEKGIAINGVRAVGSYSYIGDDGQLYSVNYTADENGFRPQGAHLPTAPPIPDAILKVIEQAALVKANGIYDDGSYDEKKYGYQRYNPTKNNKERFLNQYNKGKQVTNINKSKINNQLPHYTRLDKNIDEDNTDKENKQNVINKDTLQPFIKKDLLNESLSENSPFYKSGDVANIEKDHIDINNNGYNNKLQNEILNSKPKETEKDDRMMNIEFYDETGYHYTKPQNGYSVKAANKLINRYSETPALIKIPAIYKQTMEDIPASSQSFMIPYVPEKNIFVKHDGDDQNFDIPEKYNEEENVILSNQNTGPLSISTETKRLPSQSENRIIHNFNNQFKRPDILPSNVQGYLNIKKDNSNNVPFITSTEIGLPDITSTLPTEFPRVNSKNPTKHTETGLNQNQAAFPNPSFDHEKYREPLTHSNKLDHYGNINKNDDDAGSTYNIPNNADREYITDQYNRTYSEDFSGPKQAQGYDPLTGYHY